MIAHRKQLIGSAIALAFVAGIWSPLASSHACVQLSVNDPLALDQPESSSKSSDEPAAPPPEPAIPAADDDDPPKSPPDQTEPEKSEPILTRPRVPHPLLTSAVVVQPELATTTKDSRVDSASIRNALASATDPLAGTVSIAQELRALGRSNGPLSARPAETSDSFSAAPAWMSGQGFEFARVLGALAVVVGLILLLRSVLRRGAGVAGLEGTGAGRPSGVLQILARFPIARGQRLLVLKLGRRIVLVHQGGSTMQTLSEVVDPDEVASLLSRMEAGSTGRDAERFHDVLVEFQADHDAIARQGERQRDRVSASSPASLLRGQAQVIDLTRSRRPLASLLGRRRAK